MKAKREPMWLTYIAEAKAVLAWPFSVSRQMHAAFAKALAGCNGDLALGLSRAVARRGGGAWSVHVRRNASGSL